MFQGEEVGVVPEPVGIEEPDHPEAGPVGSDDDEHPLPESDGTCMLGRVDLAPVRENEVLASVPARLREAHAVAVVDHHGPTDGRIEHRGDAVGALALRHGGRE